MAVSVFNGRKMYRARLIFGVTAAALVSTLVFVGCSADPDFDKGKPIVWRSVLEIPINERRDPKVDSIINNRVKVKIREKLAGNEKLNEITTKPERDSLADIIAEHQGFWNLLFKDGLKKEDVGNFLTDDPTLSEWIDKFYERKKNDLVEDAVDNADLPDDMTNAEKTELKGVIAADPGVPDLLSNGCDVEEVAKYMLDTSTQVGKWLNEYNRKPGKEKVTEQNADDISKNACDEVNNSDWGGSGESGEKNVTKDGAIDMLSDEVYNEAGLIIKTVQDEYADKPVSLGDVEEIPVPDDIKEKFPPIDGAIGMNNHPEYKVYLNLVSNIPLDIKLYMLFAEGKSAKEKISEAKMNDTTFFNFIEKGRYNTPDSLYTNPLLDVDGAGLQGVPISEGGAIPLQLPDKLAKQLVDHMRGTKTVAWRFIGVMPEYDAVKEFAVERPCRESGKCVVDVKIRMKLTFANSFEVIDSLSNLDL